MERRAGYKYTMMYFSYQQLRCRCFSQKWRKTGRSPNVEGDGCIVWNAHNTVFCSKRSSICAQAVYFLHLTRPGVTCLRLSDVSVICCVTYLQFLIQACFSSTSVSQATQRRTWFTQYRTSDVAEKIGEVSCTECTALGYDYELVPTVKWNGS